MNLNLDALRRRPDFEAAGLRAWDAADTLMLDTAFADALEAKKPVSWVTGASSDTCASRASTSEVVVVGDTFGALTLGALHRGAAAVRVHQDLIAGELALAANAADLGVASERFRSMPLNAELVRGARLVLLRLPRSLDALDECAALIAAHADPSVRVFAGGRIKHMTVTMNEVLGRHFGRVDVSHARQKSRLLIATEPRPDASEVEPRREFHPDLDLWVVAKGGVFAGTSIDIGTRALLAVLDGVPLFQSAIDLGSGTGILAAELKRRRPEAEVVASDQSAAAVASAALTMEANGLDVAVARDDALSQHADASVDLIVLNPPFHSGAVVDSRIAIALFAAAARVLRPGGELWTVWNSHLAYKPALRSIVGETREVVRTAKFTVAASTRSAHTGRG